MTALVVEAEDQLGHVDLGALAWTWRDVQQARIAAQQRGHTAIADMLIPVEKAAAAATVKALRQHPIWPWLEQFPGLRGVHAARLVALIADPRRFPGQKCNRGHHSPAIYQPGDPCPFVSATDEAACDGLMGAPRAHTGVRSLWHYLGLHVVDGRSPRKTKGQKADWNPIGRTICLQPGGLAEHIVRDRVPVYRDTYDAAKARLTRVWGRADLSLETVHRGGLSPVAKRHEIEEADGRGQAEDVLDGEIADGLPPYKIDALARKIAVKAFVGDLLIAWKRIVAAADVLALEVCPGRDGAEAGA